MSSTVQETTTIPAGAYVADPSHSTVEFAARHMGISTVRGRFTKFEATLEGGDQPVVRGKIDMTSATTFDETRDVHLTSPEFFDAERYPHTTFEGRLDGDRLVGQITLKGVTKPLEFTARVTGPNTDPWGNERVGLEVTGQLSRGDYGMTFNQALGSGNMLVADKVKLALDISAIKQAA